MTSSNQQSTTAANWAQQLTLLRLENATEDSPVSLGRYNVVGLLGQGGMGTVYVAVDTNNGTRVALKTMREIEGPDTQRLKREFRTVADLVHDNLVSVYELGHQDNLWFFTMELVDGISFRRWARKATPRPPSHRLEKAQRTKSTAVACGPQGGADWPTVVARPERAEVSIGEVRASAPKRTAAELRDAFRQLVGGLKALHAIGLRHGDIKPSNVLVRPNGHVVVVDFGVSTRFQDAVDGLAGTPSYMAPEQLKGEPAGPAADWYAVGTMFYEILTGVLPFRSANPAHLYTHKVVRPPISPNLLVAVPHTLSALCLDLLSVSATARPGSSEILRRLSQNTEEPIPPSPVVGGSAFVGREVEVRQMEAAYISSLEGRLAVMFVHGPSGIGKSSAVNHFLTGDVVASAKVFHGRCYERESVPYKAFDHIIDELAVWLRGFGDEARGFLPLWIAELTHVFPALLSVKVVAAHVAKRSMAFDAQERRRRALVALAELIAELSQITPIVLSIDDLQWADRDSADLLDTLLRVASEARVVLVAGLRRREAEASDALSGFFDRCRLADRVLDIPITTLSTDETTRMAMAMFRLLANDPDETVVQRVVRESSGIPFLVEELVRFAAAHPEPSSSLSLADALASRMQGLSANRRLLLKLTAVADTPIPQLALFDAAGIDPSEMRSLLALRQASLIRWTGSATDAPVGPYHDRIREAVIENITDCQLSTYHHRLARALITHHDTVTTGVGIFDVTRHLNAARQVVSQTAERKQAASLNLRAGQRAQATAAFQLAYQLFESGIAFLDGSAWDEDYKTALDLHTGAVDAGYLSADYFNMVRWAKQVKAHGRSVLDQAPTWEAEINLHIGRQAYDEAIETSVEVLGLLGVQLKSNPTLEDVGPAIEKVMSSLAELGMEGVLALPVADDAEAAAVMNILVRLSSCAYYARPMLIPIIASHMIASSLAKGLSSATPYALAVVGVLLNSLGKFSESHAWGQLALQLLDRHPDSQLQACTRHVVHCLVCVWTVPLRTTVDDLRAVVELAQRSGDYEYAAYAAQGSVYNMLYASHPLEPLLEDALQLGEMMRSLGQVNALHAHRAFVQLLRCLRADTPAPSCLDDAGFDEGTEAVAATDSGSRHGALALRLSMGLARFYAGKMSDAAEQFEYARSYVDPTTSVWHVPIFHQFSALATCLSWQSVPVDERPARRAHVDESLAILRDLAAHGPVNFAHRVDFIEGALLALDGDTTLALQKFDRAAERAAQGRWLSDLGLAQELAADCESTPEARESRLRTAADAFELWGATAKVAQVLNRIGA